MRRPFFLCQALSLAVLTLAISAAAVLATGDKGIDQLIQETRSALQATKKREDSALGSLNKNQQELNKIQSDLHRIDKRLQTAQTQVTLASGELRRLEGGLRALESSLDKRSELLRKRLNVFYRYGPINYLEVVFSAASLGELIDRYELSSFFIRQDLRLLDQYRRTYQEIAARRIEVQARHEALASNTRAISLLQAEEAKKRQQAAVKVKQNQEQVALIQASRVRLEQALLEYERLSRELGSEMRRKGSGAALGTGTMIWPVKGRLSSGFGWRYHPVLKSKRYHNGQDIAVPSRTPVLAADSGIVRIAGWQGGYGYLVAIDHGNGLSTFYGHNSVLLVGEGAPVTKGQKIALSGSTGLSTGPHLHFEVRVNGEPVDPLKYLP